MRLEIPTELMEAKKKDLFPGADEDEVKQRRENSELLIGEQDVAVFGVVWDLHGSINELAEFLDEGGDLTKEMVSGLKMDLYRAIDRLKEAGL